MVRVSQNYRRVVNEVEWQLYLKDEIDDGNEVDQYAVHVASEEKW
jgi:hypothetical protein